MTGSVLYFSLNPQWKHFTRFNFTHIITYRELLYDLSAPLQTQSHTCSASKHYFDSWRCVCVITDVWYAVCALDGVLGFRQNGALAGDPELSVTSQARKSAWGWRVEGGVLPCIDVPLAIEQRTWIHVSYLVMCWAVVSVYLK